MSYTGVPIPKAREREAVMTSLDMVDMQTGRLCTFFVAKKGKCPHAVEQLGGMLGQL